jgi:predicted dinucleotide-utilizing enzyme
MNWSFSMLMGKSRETQRLIKIPVKIVANVDELLASKPSIVVEAASQQAVRANTITKFSGKYRFYRYEHWRSSGFKHPKP